MFKYLKRQFIVIYTLSIFILVLFSFSFIFYSSYKSIEKDISMRLGMKEIYEIDDDNKYHDEGKDRAINVFGDDIYLIVDEDRNILSAASKYNISDENIDNIQEQLKNTDKKIIKNDDKYYTYVDQQYVIKLVDITNSVKVLSNLAITLIIIGIIINVSAVVVGNFFATKALKPVKESYDRQKAFVSDASHEIKTPISVISSCLDLIKEKDDESDKWLDYCISETSRLKKLTANLLTLSQNEQKPELASLKKINISEVIELLLCAYEVKLFEENYILNIDIQDDLYTNIIEDDFKQLFHILMDNAIKYNTVEKVINISLKEYDRAIEFKIENSSDELENGDISKIFNRFYRKDKVRSKKIEGFGLGLALVKQIFEKYNVKYSVKYKENMFIFSMKFEQV